MGTLNMNKGSRTTILLLLLLSMTLQFCGTSKKTIPAEPDAMAVHRAAYDRDIQPIMAAKCTPCHFPETGKKMMLDTYEATRDNIQDILRRVQLPADHMEFMPFKSKKPALTAEEIQLLKDWGAARMHE